jgi:hypothetical protein
MFIMGFHFPADMGNDINDDLVIEKMEETIKGVSGVKGFKLTYGKDFEHETVYNKTDTVLGKALISYYTMQDPEQTEGAKYFIYTNRYQMSELAKKYDKDPETQALCTLFNGMDMFKLELV